MNFSNEFFETDPFAEDFLNQSFTTNASAPVFPPATSPAQPAVIITVAVLAIVGNLLVIAVTTRRQTFPSASRLFISSMAWSDLLQGLTFTGMVAPAGAGEWMYSDTAAQACVIIAGSSLALSFSALAGLNLDRHYALMNDGAGISPKKARIFLVSAWVGIYAWYIFWTVYGVPVYYDSAMAVVTYDITANMWFTPVSLGILCSPLIVTMYCVVRILSALCTQHERPAAPVININVNGPGVPPQNANPQQQPPNNLQQQLQNNPQQQPQNNPRQQPQNNPQQQPQNYNSDRSYAKVVLILTLIQAVMPIPALCAFIASQLGHDLPTFLFWSFWVAMSSTFWNVLVCSVFHKSFRKAVAETAVYSYMYIVCCIRGRVDVDDQQNIQMNSL